MRPCKLTLLVRYNCSQCTSRRPPAVLCRLATVVMIPATILMPYTGGHPVAEIRSHLRRQECGTLHRTTLQRSPAEAGRRTAARVTCSRQALAAAAMVRSRTGARHGREAREQGRIIVCKGSLRDIHRIVPKCRPVSLQQPVRGENLPDISLPKAVKLYESFLCGCRTFDRAQ